MNYKKGALRVLILGVILSSITGFIRGHKEIKDVRQSMIMATAGAKMAIKDQTCIESIKQNTVYRIEKPLWQSCRMLEIYWSDIEKYQGNPPNFKGIEETMSHKSILKQVEIWSLAFLNTLILYIAVCLFIGALLLSGKWVYKGFKS
jgi:hypothetical protein